MTGRDAITVVAPWLQHYPDCPRRVNASEDCDCGLSAALRMAREPEAPTHIPLSHERIAELKAQWTVRRS